ncbi:hypothetical protein ASG43_13050 [Aureimonas sp. Leaf454]|uniref:type II toxin-antitoxin system HicA family toxin n=1 Tax=Aureimonas sp. Leaf454 TaxID=1736381 RepID=UPI0006F9639B|nr:type II toxin-antitoxin system HicA family toxin [Aureimonas sp. Leaf454]KQT45210.1 hypothetical protein ASG43_13050 [Aureimonas sp. Leaf454]
MVALPACNGRAVIRALERPGFTVIRVAGSHHVMRHGAPPQRTVTVPMHNWHELKRATLASILRQADISVEAFFDLL